MSTDFETSKLYELISLADEGLPQAVHTEIKGGADVNARDEFGDGYLHLLCGNSGLHNCTPDRYIPVIFALSNVGIDVNIRNNSGNTALHFAVTNKLPNIVVNALLKIGADPKIVNNEELSAENVCTDPVHRKTIQLFEPGLYGAIKAKSFNDVERLLDSWCVLPLRQRDIVTTDEGIAQDADDNEIQTKVKIELERNNFYHLALADDRPKLKVSYKKDSIDLNSQDLSYVDIDSVNYPKPLIAYLLDINASSAVKFLLKKGIDVNIPVTDENGSRMPYFIFACKNSDKRFHNILISIMKHANIEPFIPKISMKFLHQLWQTEVPSEVLGAIVDGGFNLGLRDKDCLTLRDRIFFDSLSFEPARIKDSLLWVDQQVLNMVQQGKLHQLEDLFHRGYEYLIVENLQGRNSISWAKKHNQKDIAAFLEEIPVLQKNARSIFCAIRRGNLSVMKELINDKNCKVRDGAGRTFLHIAALFTRRFMVNFLVKLYPYLVHDKDVFGRGPLHYASLAADGMDIELVLVNAGASMDMEDVNGYKPKDYKKGCMGNDFLELERQVKYGIDVYLVQRYFEFVSAIKNGFDEKVTRIHKSLYEDATWNDFERLDSAIKEQISYRNLVFQAIDENREKIAVYLIQEGMDPTVDEIVPDDENGSCVISMLEAATEQEMYDLVKVLKKKKVPTATMS